MGAIAPINILDGAATPVSRTFEPTGKSPGRVVYHDKSGGTFIGYPSMVISNRIPTRSNSNYKVTMTLKFPVLETVAPNSSGITPGPTLSYDLMANFDFVIPSRATSLERDHIYALLKNALSDSTVESIVKEMALPY
jgi:hypothetical protein